MEPNNGTRAKVAMVGRSHRANIIRHRVINNFRADYALYGVKLLIGHTMEQLFDMKTIFLLFKTQ